MDTDEIYVALLERIESQLYKVGHKIPTERDLAKEFKTPQWRVHLACNKLEENGFIERRRKVGTFVRKDIDLENVSRKKNKTSNRVVVVVSKNFYFQVEGFHDIIGDLERSLELNGSEVSYSVFPNSHDELKRFLSDTANDAKALVLFPENKEWDFIHENLGSLIDYPGNVFYFNRGKGPDYVFPFNSITIDHYGSGICAARFVNAKGFENIAYFTSILDSFWITQRYSGFKETLRSLRLDHVLFSQPEIETLWESLANYIKQCESIPVIVCATDQTAASVSAQMRLEGLMTGKDFALVGFDNHPKYRSVKMTTIAWPMEKIGEIMSDCIGKIKDDEFHDYRINKCIISPILVDRTNTEVIK